MYFPFALSSFLLEQLPEGCIDVAYTKGLLTTVTIWKRREEKCRFNVTQTYKSLAFIVISICKL